MQSLTDHELPQISNLSAPERASRTARYGQCRIFILAILLMFVSAVFAQSSSNFRIEGGRLTATSQPFAPSSSSFRVDGGVNGDGANGLATSPNFQVISGVPAPSEAVFRNGFEN